jgi:hypothetical protein
MTALPRKACPTCGRVVAWRTVRGTPRSLAGETPLRVPVRHRRPVGGVANPITLGDWCRGGEAVR